MLVAITARFQGGNDFLEWGTASEQYKAYFQIESSADGRTFTLLKQVVGEGTSAGRHAY